MTNTPTLPEGTPETIGDFRIVRELGRGGMGVVFEAEQRTMRRRVALKVLSLSFTSAPRAVKRFQREAQAAGRLHHTNIVPVYAIAQHGNFWYYAMELVEGRPLSDVIAELRCAGRPDEETLGELVTPGTGARTYYARIAEMFAGVAEALDLAHHEGVVHRDLKPSNLLFAADGTLKIVDFGLARTADQGSSLTLTGDLLGTPLYMSPEQAMAKRVTVDHRTDIYSLGATLYEVIALRPPYEGATLQAICSQIISKEPKAPRTSNARVPRDLETIVLKAMDKDRDKRYQSAGALARDLRRFALGEPIRARRIGSVARSWRFVKRRPRRSALTAAVVVSAAAGIYYWQRGSEEAERRRQLEYAWLCAQADEEMARAIGTDRAPELLEPFRDRSGLHGSDAGNTAHALYSQAAALLPDRPEAYLGRALCPGPSFEQRLADLEAARPRISKRTYHSALAHLLGSAGRWDEAAQHEQEAERHPLSSPADLYFEAVFRARRGDVNGALELLGKADAQLRGEALRTLVLRARARLLERLGREADSLADLHALQELGDDSIALQVRIAQAWHGAGQEAVADREFDEILADAIARREQRDWFELCDRTLATGQLDWAGRALDEAQLRWPGNARFWSGRAELLLRRRRPSEALEAIERAFRDGEGDHKAWEVKAIALFELGRDEDAVEAFDRALATGVRCILSLRFKTAALERLKRYDEALSVSHEAIRLDPALPITRVMLGSIHQERGEFEDADRVFTTAMRLAPWSAAPYNSRGGMRSDDLGQHELALADFDRAIELKPDDPIGHFNRGLALGRLKRWDEAADALARAAEMRPEDCKAHLELWKAQAEAGRDDERQRAIEAAASLSPAPHLQHLRGHALQHLEMWEEALAAYRAVAEHRTADREILADIGLMLQELGREREAVEVYDRSLALQEHHVVYSNRGNALSRLGKHEEALASFTRSLEIKPDYYWSHFNRAMEYFRLKKFSKALDDFRKAAELGCEAGDCFRFMAKSLLALRRPKEAHAALDRAVEVAPDSVAVYVDRGAFLHDVARRPKEALRDFDRAVEIDPKAADAWGNRGIALSSLRRFKDAAQSFAKARALNPQKLRFVFKQGQAHLNAGDGKAAEACMRVLVEKRPNDANAHYWVANALMQQGRLEEAVACFDKAIELAPEGAGAYFNKAHIHLDWEKYAEAEALAREGLKRRGSDFGEWILAEALREQGKTDAALAAFARAIEYNPRYLQAHNGRVAMLLDAHRFEEALKLAKIGERQTHHPALTLQRGLALKGMHRYQEALTAYDQVPEYPGVRWERGWVLYELQRFDEARAEWERLHEQQPEDASVAVELVFTLARLGRFEEAGNVLLQAEQPGALDARYLALTLAGRWEEALAVARRMDNAGAVASCLRALGRPVPAVVTRPKGGPMEVAYAYAVAGDAEHARKELDDYRYVWTPDDAFERARIHTVLGERDAALEWLEKAAAAGERLPKNGVIHPDLDGLRAEPRFIAAMAKIRK